MENQEQVQSEVQEELFKDTEYNLENRLKVWREERHLTQEGQVAGILGNLAEELTELLRANTEDELIDALLDAYVYYHNAYLVPIEYPFIPQIKDHIHGCKTFDSLKSFLAINISGVINGLLEQKLHKELHPDMVMPEEELKNHLKGMTIFTANALESLGYDFFKTLNEVVKVCESRTGAWSEELKKFVKDPNVQQYVPDFNACKRPVEVEVVE